MTRIVLNGLDHSTLDYRLFIEPMYIGITVFHKDKGIPVGNCECSLIKNKVWYFNRLFVQPEYRNKGIGTAMLKELLLIIEEKEDVLQLDINPYGEMSYEQLEEFYIQSGFVKTIESNTELGDYPRYYYNAFIRKEYNESTTN